MTTLEEKHGVRLDGHDAELSSLRKSVAQIQNDTARIFNAITTQALVLERVDKGMLAILSFLERR